MSAIIIITGFGDHFWNANEEESDVGYPEEDWEEPSLLEIVMRIPVPVIAAINGPVRQYCEIPLVSDVVLASESVEFQETQCNLVQSVADREVRRLALHSLLGLNRARYFLLTGKSIPVKEARKTGLVAEIMRKDDLLNRAREIAFMLTRRPSNDLRQIRKSFLRELQRKVDDSIGGMVICDSSDQAKNLYSKFLENYSNSNAKNENSLSAKLILHDVDDIEMTIIGTCSKHVKK